MIPVAGLPASRVELQLVDIEGLCRGPSPDEQHTGELYDSIIVLHIVDGGKGSCRIRVLEIEMESSAVSFLCGSAYNHTTVQDLI